MSRNGAEEEKSVNKGRGYVVAESRLLLIIDKEERVLVKTTGKACLKFQEIREREKCYIGVNTLSVEYKEMLYQQERVLCTMSEFIQQEVEMSDEGDDLGLGHGRVREGGHTAS